MSPNTAQLDAADETPKLSSAARMLRILSAVADSAEPVAVRDLGRKLGQSPATTHRLLNVLRDEGFVDYVADRRAYGIGPQLYRVAARVTQRVGPVTLAKNVAARAAAEFDETILFGLHLPHAGAMSFEARADGQKKLMYHVEMHTPVPLVWGASGKSILAYLPGDERESVYDNAEASPATDAPRPTRDALERELGDIRRRGHAVTHGEKLPGARGIAAPVFGSAGVIGSLCLTSPRERVPESMLSEIGQRVMEYAEQLSHQLGASPPIS